MFSNAVYEETRGHPYLTVNLMVDFCDWLIETAAEGEGELSANAFRSFQRDRLTSGSLQRSPHYAFFIGMLGESLSARGRRTEPWLYAVASVLQELGKRKQGLSITAFHKMAAPYCVDAGLTPQQLLQSAAMANFVRISEAQVVPAIPLLGRLAAVALPRIN